MNPLYQNNVRHGHNSALTWEVIRACTTTVQMSLNEGVPFNICDEFLEWKPTALAAIYGQGAILQLLVRDWRQSEPESRLGQLSQRAL